MTGLIVDDVMRLDTRTLKALAESITRELETRQQAEDLRCRRGAFEVRFGRLCSWCLVEDGARPVYEGQVPTGQYVGPDCRARSAFIVSPEKWRAMHDPAPVNAEVTGWLP